MRVFVRYLLLQAVNAIVVINLIVVLWFLFVPHTFHRTDAAKSFSTADHLHPINVADKNESWPFEIRTDLIHHFCKRPSSTPSSIAEISDDQVLAAWHLPSNSTLSSSMSEIGRCQLLTAHRRRHHHQDLSCDGFGDVCFCMGDATFGGAIFVFALIVVFAALCLAIRAIVIDSYAIVAKTNVGSLAAMRMCIVGVYHLLLSNVLFLIVLMIPSIVDDNVFATIDAVPYRYYRSIEGKLILWLLYANGIIFWVQGAVLDVRGFLDALKIRSDAKKINEGKNRESTKIPEKKASEFSLI